MTAFRVEQSEHLSAEERVFWSDALRDQDFGELTVPWTEATRAVGPANLEISYLQVYQGEQRCALVVVHVLRRLDLSGYMGARIKSIFAPIAKLGLRPLALDLAFLEVPLANMSGIRFAAGAESQSASIAEAVLAHMRKNFRYGVLCLKATGGPGEGDFESLGLMKTNFLARMMLKLRGEKTYEEFLLGMVSKTRYECKRYAKEFRDAGGTVEMVEHPDESVFDMMDVLYANTLRHHAEGSNLQLPIPLKPGLFRSLMAELPGKSRVFVGRLHGEPIAFMMVLSSGDCSYATHCGLDYARSVPSRAYFNLYYAAIEDAIRRGDRLLGLGSEAYVLKRKLGGVPHPTVYHFEVRNRLLRGIMGIVARNFESEEGSKMKSD